MQEWYGDLSNMAKRYGMKEAAERRSKTKKKEPSEYMKGVYGRLVAARVPKKKALPLNKNISRAKGRWVKDEFESGTYTTRKGKKETVSSWTFVGESKRKLGSDKPQ